VLNQVLNAPLQEIYHPDFTKRQVRLYIKREDLIHPHISGNKWRKLKYNLVEAKKQGKKKLLTFGGAYSNHIAATAFAGKEYGFETIGIIRGEEHLPLNPTLQSVKNWGMDLHYVDRESYRDKDSEVFIASLKNRFGDFYLLPEGGANNLAVKGCAEIVNNISVQFNYICCPCGTATTLSGIASSLNSNQKAIGFAALKGGDFLNDNVEAFIGKGFDNWEINNDYHFGGYAKHSKELIDFIDMFAEYHAVPLEPIYTGKMMYGIFDLLNKGFFPEGSSIIAVHTGGLQGGRSLKFKV
jgi:1-aminocyclopropane-1-carboxylate deaminase